MSSSQSTEKNCSLIEDACQSYIKTKVKSCLSQLIFLIIVFWPREQKQKHEAATQKVTYGKCTFRVEFISSFNFEKELLLIVAIFSVGL